MNLPAIPDLLSYQRQQDAQALQNAQQSTQNTMSLMMHLQQKQEAEAKQQQEEAKRKADAGVQVLAKHLEQLSIADPNNYSKQYEGILSRPDVQSLVGQSNLGQELLGPEGYFSPGMVQARALAEKASKEEEKKRKSAEADEQANRQLALEDKRRKAEFNFQTQTAATKGKAVGTYEAEAELARRTSEAGQALTQNDIERNRALQVEKDALKPVVLFMPDQGFAKVSTARADQILSSGKVNAYPMTEEAAKVYSDFLADEAAFNQGIQNFQKRKSSAGSPELTMLMKMAGENAENEGGLTNESLAYNRMVKNYIGTDDGITSVTQKDGVEVPVIRGARKLHAINEVAAVNGLLQDYMQGNLVPEDLDSYLQNPVYVSSQANYGRPSPFIAVFKAIKQALLSDDPQQFVPAAQNLQKQLPVATRIP